MLNGQKLLLRFRKCTFSYNIHSCVIYKKNRINWLTVFAGSKTSLVSNQKIPVSEDHINVDIYVVSIPTRKETILPAN